MLYAEAGRLVYRYDAEELWLEGWGEDALRIRATKMSTMPPEDWALQEVPKPTTSDIRLGKEQASISNGKIKAVVSSRGKIMIYKSNGDLLLEEYARHRLDPTDPKCSALNVEAREFKPIIGGNYSLNMRLESVAKDEKIYGMV